MSHMLNFSTPETFFTPSLEAPNEFPLDALVCAVARSQAIVALLMRQFDGGDSAQLDHDTLCNALWNVAGNLDFMQAMLACSTHEPSDALPAT